MGFRVVLFACAVFVLGATGAVAAVITHAQRDALVARLDRQAMIFFVAKGGANACGPGCSEWIAAEGAFDSNVGRRFQDFLDKLPRRDLPVFFNSIGGHNVEAVKVGKLLRENRMTTGVGRSLPDGCAGAAVTDACRRTMQAKREHRARLVTKDAQCASACLYAFLGGAQRRVAQDAKLGIHSARLPAGQKVLDRVVTIDDVHNWAKGYIVEFGVNPALVDAAASVSTYRMHFMSRDQIARFGVETRGTYETPWMFDKTPPTSTKSVGRFFIRKALTQSTAAGTEYQTTMIRIGCPNVWDLWFIYRRETVADEKSGDVVALLGGTQTPLTATLDSLERDIDARRATVNLDLLRKAAAEPAIEITALVLVDGEYKPRVSRLSTAGLSQALDLLAKHCVVASPPQATAR